MQFIPAILTDSIPDLKEQLHRLQPYFKRYSIDIEDGVFATSRTYQIADLVKSAKEWVTDDLKSSTFDFDLMVNEWEADLKLLAELNRSVHIENVFLHAQTLKNKPYPITNNLPFSIGLAIDPEDKIEDLASQFDLNTFPAVQIMTIHSGAQMQSMMPDLLNKIGTLRDKDYRNKIYIDGGVNEQTIQAVLGHPALPDFACVGGYLSHAGDDLLRRIKHLKYIEEFTAKAAGV